MKRDIIIIDNKAVSVTGNDVWMAATEIAGLFHTTVPAVNAAIKAVRKSDVLNDYKVCRYMQLENGLYADVSALLCINKARILPHLKTQTQIHDKILFGTDFPVPFSVILSSYDLPFCKRLTLNRIQNPLDRYVRAMSLYFGEDSPLFSNYKMLESILLIKKSFGLVLCNFITHIRNKRG